MMEYIPSKTILLPKSPAESLLGEAHSYTLNIYRGCSHGCIYCDSRSDCYRIEDFDRVRGKADALRILEAELRRKRQPGIANTGAATDPYNPQEANSLLSRGVLELLHKYRFGVCVTTKSTLVCRDIDLLQAIGKRAPCHVLMTVTTTDDELCRRIEPHVSCSGQRFEALQKLSAAGIITGIFLNPVLPFLTDSEENILGIVRRAAACGVRYILCYFGMTLRSGNREYYYAALDRLMPGMKERYMREFGERYSCPSPRADTLYRLFQQECRRLGILTERASIRRLLADSVEEQQLSLL